MTELLVLAAGPFILRGLYGGDGMPPARANQNAAMAVSFIGLAFLAAPAIAIGVAAPKASHRVLAVSQFAPGTVIAAVTVCLALVFGLSGPPSKTITQAQATAWTQQIVRAVASVLGPRPRLIHAPSLDESGQCVDGTIGAIQMITAGRAYWLRGIPSSQDDRIGRQALVFWKKQRYAIRIADLYGNESDITATAGDGFTIALEWSEGGALSIDAISPRIYPHGHPPS